MSHIFEMENLTWVAHFLNILVISHLLWFRSPFWNVLVFDKQLLNFTIFLFYFCDMPDPRTSDSSWIYYIFFHVIFWFNLFSRFPSFICRRETKFSYDINTVNVVGIRLPTAPTDIRLSSHLCCVKFLCLIVLCIGE